MKHRLFWLCLFIIGLVPTGLQAQTNQSEAQRRIQDAMTLQSLELDLSGLGLTELPSDIGLLSRLQVLNLSNNHLQALPPEIGNLANLQVLNLSANPLTDLPPDIGRLSGLQMLDLSETALSQFPPPVLQLGNLRWLNLGHTRVSQLPPEIASLTRLQWLDVLYTPISELPPEMSRLTDLQWLDLSYTAVSQLPIELAELTGLRALITDGTPWFGQNPLISNGTVAEIQAYLRAPIQSEQLPPREPVTITWYVGLVAGDKAEQIEVQERVAAEFNASQDAIILEFQCICANSTPANDMLKTFIDSGMQVDIVGPIGFASANAFKEFAEIEWLDLQPLIQSHGYDLSPFPSNMVETYRTPDGGLSALPFAAYPGVLYYNADLFDAAGLNYPPTVPGEAYIMPDGSQLPWDYETVALIGPLLTLDANGNNATHPDFDPANVVQFGFAHQWDTVRSSFHTFGDAPLMDEYGRIIFPENWRAQAHWYSDGIWKGRFIPNEVQLAKDELHYNPFASGRVAMARSMAWYMCCLDELDAHWDIALQPAYQGTIYAPADFDSFYIYDETEHPDEVFIVLEYLLGAGAFDLLETYQALPARPDLHAASFGRYQERYPTVQNWEVFTTSAQFAPAIHHESDTANYYDGYYRFYDFLWLMRGKDGENGATIDLDVELDRLQSDLQDIIAAGTGADAGCQTRLVAYQRGSRSVPYDQMPEARRLIEQARAQNATTLDLSGLYLTGLPPELWKLSQLESLDLSDNYICGLPAAIRHLTNLKWLDLGDTPYMYKLPAVIGQLSNLETLILHKTWIRDFPKTIGDLSNLRVLDLSMSQFDELPPQITGLVNLEVLDLSDTHQYTLSPEIGRLVNLQSLDLSRNNLETLPPEIGRLTKLRWLDLSSNYFAEFPAEIGHLSGLHTLNLSDNSHNIAEAEQVPPEIGYLAELQTLNLTETEWESTHWDLNQTSITAVQNHLRNLRAPSGSTPPIYKRNPIQILWSVGDIPDSQLAAEQLRVEAFNNSQNQISLIHPKPRIELIENRNTDIVGPMSIGASHTAFGTWLDLQPLVDSTGYDLSRFPEEILAPYRSPNGGLTALPFAVSPSVLLYNPKLFDAAGLNYPPTVPGAPYIMPDGSSVPWDYDTVAAIAPLLTVDINGHNLTSPDFDPAQIMQYGFNQVGGNTISRLNSFGATPLIDEAGLPNIPDHWRAQIAWMRSGIKSHFIPPRTLQPYDVNPTFEAGRLAMNHSKLGYINTLPDEFVNWDLAIPPAYQGQIYAPMDRISFYVPQGVRDPNAVFATLTYLLGESAAVDTLMLYGAYPADPSLYAAFNAQLAAHFPHVQHWEVVAESIALSSLPYHEAWFPGYELVQERIENFSWLLDGGYPQFDMDKALDRLELDLQAIVIAAR